MIILTLNPKRHPTVLTFNKDIVIIGSPGQSETDEIDIPLKEEGISSEHLKIQQIEERYIIYNVANDPFLSLNGQPFGKKTLKKGDLIGIGGIEILFDFKKEETPPLATAEDNNVSNLNIAELIHQTEQLEPDANLPPLFNIEEGHKDNDVDQLEQEIETEIALNHSKIKRKTPEPLDISDETPNRNISSQWRESLAQEIKEFENSRDNLSALEAGIKWRRLAFILVIFLIISGIVLSGIYLIVSEQTSIQEVHAAQGVADVTMALTYAQLHHLKPMNQNWGDPDFLRENIKTVLSSKYSPLSDVDIQGQFSNCPYILRVYTSSDHSHFLVIAQPAPSLLQWIFPKTAILVDSHTMEIRKTKDLRTLNRLLVDPNNLDSSNTPEISNLVHQGGIIPLSLLAVNEEHLEFAPPKELAFIRPEAENLIYNAPRYYKFSEPIVKKVELLNENPESAENIAPLLQDIAMVSKLHNIVLYSTRGIEGALEIQKGIMPYAPGQGFLVGYVSFSTKTDLIDGSHLILVANQFSRNMISQEKASALTNDPDIPVKEDTLTELNTRHPLFSQLAGLAEVRQQKLGEITELLVTQIDNNTRLATKNFPEEFQQTLTQYQLWDAKTKASIESSLLRLYHNYVESEKELSPEVFLSYIDNAELGNFMHDGMKTQTLLDREGISPEILFEQLSEKIIKAKDFQALDDAIEEAAYLLTAEHFSNRERLASLHNHLRLKTTQKLENFLLFSPAQLPAGTFQEKNRWILLRILKNGRITDPDERDFYLSEFDYLSKES